MGKYLFLLALSLSSCSTLSILNSPSEAYRSHVRREVQEQRIFDRGRLVLSIKVLAATKSLKDVQEAVSPGHGFEYKDNLRQVIVAVGLPNASDFAVPDLKMLLGGRNADWIHEIDNPLLVETHYFFAHPFHRTFLIDFSKPEANISQEKIEIRTPRGAVTFDLDFSVEVK